MDEGNSDGGRKGRNNRVEEQRKGVRQAEKKIDKIWRKEIRARRRKSFSEIRSNV